ncbi:gluconate 2-dehydrogenase subunit 3 family protein [Acetobacter senegalensis]|uniref:gluconate 2-dehydrogenase subunit 3 family protein n=1 Tax=Acetobacter senegalensis TaxID=446692 RepID=UPI001EDCD878|nr:gluconate 2-dehydrogenase subunit 3 family protein [Acetobacter senegalensis]MCG4273168.1 gluconate 2-dehydrogenase subunit 3 family protein [Acetobacter senegalensis]
MSDISRKGGSLVYGRRALVQGTALGLLAASLFRLSSGGESQAADQTIDADYAYQPLFFSHDEWQTLNSFVDRLIPADAEGPGALEAHVPEFIDRQMNTPYGHGGEWYLRPPFIKTSATLGYQLSFTPRDIYKHGLPALNDAVQQRYGKPFHQLDAAERDGVIGQMEKGALSLSPIPAKLLFGQILKNCKEGYFADPIHGGNYQMSAWKMIGFPGARADFTDWVDRYGARYPLPPVSVGGHAVQGGA